MAEMDPVQWRCEIFVPRADINGRRASSLWYSGRGSNKRVLGLAQKEKKGREEKPFASPLRPQPSLSCRRRDLIVGQPEATYLARVCGSAFRSHFPPLLLLRQVSSPVQVGKQSLIRCHPLLTALPLVRPFVCLSLKRHPVVSSTFAHPSCRPIRGRLLRILHPSFSSSASFRLLGTTRSPTFNENDVVLNGATSEAALPQRRRIRSNRLEALLGPGRIQH